MERRGIAQHGAGDVVAGGEEHVTLGERDQVVGLVAQAGVERVRVVEVSSQEGVVGGGDGLQTKAHRYGIKVWFGPVKATREHYEAQVLGAKHVPEATVLTIEVGFHAENADPKRNEEALAELVGQEKRWRKALGPEPVAAPFTADRHGWQRLSETWPDPDIGDPDLAFDLAARLTDYIATLEPLRSC